jgi:hypothetical protein
MITGSQAMRLRQRPIRVRNKDGVGGSSIGETFRQGSEPTFRWRAVEKVKAVIRVNDGQTQVGGGREEPGTTAVCVHKVRAKSLGYRTNPAGNASCGRPIEHVKLATICADRLGLTKEIGLRLSDQAKSKAIGKPR